MSVWACNAMEYTLSFEKFIYLLIFTTSIGVKSLDGKIELSLNIFMKINKNIIYFTFIFEKENPSVSCKIIKKMDKITKTNIL